MIKLDILGNFGLIMSDLALVRVKLHVAKLPCHKYVNGYIDFSESVGSLKTIFDDREITAAVSLVVIN